MEQAACGSLSDYMAMSNYSETHFIDDRKGVLVCSGHRPQVSLDEYPANKHYAFTNSSRPGIFLDGEYDVLLANIIFTVDIITIIGRDV